MPQKPKRHQPGPRKPDFSRGGQPHRKLYSRRCYRDSFRARMLAEHPFCQDCDRELSTDVHHVRKLSAHPEDLLDPEQVLCLCSDCHDIRTRRGE